MDACVIFVNTSEVFLVLGLFINQKFEKSGDHYSSA